MNNKIWATRNARRPVTAKRTLIVKKVMVAVFFFDINGHRVQVFVPKGRTMTGLFYTRRIRGKLNQHLKQVG